MATKRRKPELRLICSALDAQAAAKKAEKRQTPEEPGLPPPPEPPEWLSETAREWWAEAVPQLAAVGCATPLDVWNLALMASEWSEMMDARRVIDGGDEGEEGEEGGEGGEYFETPSGYKALHPMVIVRQRSLENFRKLARHYPLNPMARSELGLELDPRMTSVLDGDERAVFG